MKTSHLMQERIHRVNVLLRELGYELLDEEGSEEMFSAGFASPDAFQAVLFIDADSTFLEFAFTFGLSDSMADFVRERLEECIQALYEFGCYFTLQIDEKDIIYTIFSKIYFVGLNYFALQETLRDFRHAIEASRAIFEIRADEQQGESRGNA